MPKLQTHTETSDAPKYHRLKPPKNHCLKPPKTSSSKTTRNAKGKQPKNNQIAGLFFFPNTLSILVLSILCTNLCLGRPSKESQNAKPHFHLKCKGDVASKFLNRFSGAEFCTEFDKRINRAPARGARAHFAFQEFPARFLKRVQNAGGQFLSRFGLARKSSQNSLQNSSQNSSQNFWAKICVFSLLWFSVAVGTCRIFS